MNVKFKLVCFVAVMVFGVAVSNVSGMNKPHGEYIVCKTANVIDAKVYDNNCALLDGECVIEYPDKTVYKGRLKSGVFEGKGKLMWPDGCIYEGDFANGKYEGEGKYRSADGKVVHDGIWKNDRAVRNSDAVDPMNHIVVGFGGVTIDREGRLFFVKGDFLNGAYRVKYPDWSVYEGQFANGKKHGEGVLVLFNGEVYDGKWRDGKYIEGIHSSKTVYKGRKAFGCYQRTSDQGADKIKSLNEPSGTYTTDRNAGEPTDRLAVSIEGKFCDSQTNVPLEGNFRLKNGFTFIGDFKEGKFNGEGHIIAPNGQLLYYGRFKNGAFDGKGVLMLPNGEVYEGKFANGKKHGEGTLTLSGGKVLNGEWEAGVLAARFTEG